MLFMDIVCTHTATPKAHKRNDGRGYWGQTPLPPHPYILKLKHPSTALKIRNVHRLQESYGYFIK